MLTVSEYYLKKYGEPERRAEFKTLDKTIIEIYKWSEAQTDEGVAVYATCGAHVLLGDKESGCEFFIGLSPEVDDIAQALAETAMTGNGSKNIPASGDSITLVDELWLGTTARCFMFTDGSELLEPIEVNGRKIEFIQLVPLFNSELQFKTENGEAALWKLFDDKQVPYWDSHRERAI